MEKLIEQIGRDMGVAQGMAGVACVCCGILLSMTLNQKKEIRKIKENMGSKEEA